MSRRIPNMLICLGYLNKRQSHFKLLSISIILVEERYREYDSRLLVVLWGYSHAKQSPLMEIWGTYVNDPCSAEFQLLEKRTTANTIAILSTQPIVEPKK